MFIRSSGDRNKPLRPDSGVVGHMCDVATRVLPEVRKPLGACGVRNKLLDGVWHVAHQRNRAGLPSDPSKPALATWVAVERSAPFIHLVSIPLRGWIETRALRNEDVPPVGTACDPATECGRSLLPSAGTGARAARPLRPAWKVADASLPWVSKSREMNEYHKLCGSDEWRAVVRDSILPWALGDLDLGDDVLEVGPGYGATTDVLGKLVPKLTAVEIDPDLAAMLMDRFAGNGSVSIVRGDATALAFPDERFSGAASFTMLHHVPTAALQDRLFAEIGRVLRSGGVFVVGDSLASSELEAHHESDTYNPIDPETLVVRLEASGLAEVEVKTNPFGWTARAKKR